MYHLLKSFVPKEIKRYCWKNIDLLKIKAGQYLIPDSEVEAFIESISALKIAFVKQEITTDLYCYPTSSHSKKEVIFSSIHRSGPVGLFAKFDTDFFILKVEEAEECNVWKFRPVDCGGPPLELFEKFKSEIVFRKNGEQINDKPQSYYAVKADDVNWGKYDLVISDDVSIPARITKKYPNAKWCYMISEPAMRHYRLSHEKPIPGYDFFLNQRYRTVKLNPRPKYHEIDFPYHLHYYGCFHDLLNVPLDFYVREGVFVENRTSSGLSDSDYEILKKHGSVRVPAEETLENVIHKELKSKYFFSLTRGLIRSRIWGNGIIEAVACGCLAFGNPEEYGNKDLFTPFTIINSLEEFVDKIKYMENKPVKYQRELNKQRRLLNYLCFVRPMSEIIKRKRRTYV